MTPIGKRCASCDARLAERQRWCLACGAAAGTTIAATPERWTWWAAATALVGVLALAGVGYAVATVLA